ncbi:MAG: pseudomurein-binding repeat-containing protein, partial [Methanobacteriaceae archaeon]
KNISNSKTEYQLDTFKINSKIKKAIPILFFLSLIVVLCVGTVSAATLTNNGRNISADIVKSSESTVFKTKTATVTNKLTVKDIAGASTYIKKYYDKNSNLPEYVTISGKKYTTAQYLYLSSSAIVKINSSSKSTLNSQIVIKDVKSATNPSGNCINKSLSKVNYIDLAKRTKNFIDKNKIAPNYGTTPLGQLKYEDGIYNFAAILSSYEKTEKLPNLVKIKSSVSPIINAVEITAKSLKNLSGYEGLRTLQQYIGKNFRHGLGLGTTYAAVERNRGGDCWGLADWAATVLKSNGYLPRVVQGASSAAYNHRWVQVKMDGKWINFESTLVSRTHGNIDYTRTCASVRNIIKVY